MPTDKPRADVASMLDGHLALLEKIIDTPIEESDRTHAAQDIYISDPRIARVVTLVAREFGMNEAKLLAGHFGRIFSKARRVLIYLLRQEFNVRLELIRQLTNVSQSSCDHATYEVALMRRHDEQLNARLTRLEAAIRQPAEETTAVVTKPPMRFILPKPIPQPVEVPKPTPVVEQLPAPRLAPLTQAPAGDQLQQLEQNLTRLEAEQAAANNRRAEINAHVAQLNQELIDIEAQLAQRLVVITRLRKLRDDAQALDNEIARLISETEGK